MIVFNRSGALAPLLFFFFAAGSCEDCTMRGRGVLCAGGAWAVWGGGEREVEVFRLSSADDQIP